MPKESVKKALPEAMITATELTKKYGDFIAVDGGFGWFGWWDLEKASHFFQNLADPLFF